MELDADVHQFKSSRVDLIYKPIEYCLDDIKHFRLRVATVRKLADQVLNRDEVLDVVLRSK